MSNFFLQQFNVYMPDLLKLLAVLLVYFLLDLGAWYKTTLKPKFEAYIDAHTTAAQRSAFQANESLLKALGRAAYVYAENVYGTLGGPGKLAQALAYFQANMSRYGLTNLTPDVIRGSIEDAWRQDNPGKTPKVSAPATPPTTSSAASSVS